MLTLVTPRSRARKNVSDQNSVNCYSFILVVALLAFATGCSSLNAGGDAMTTAKPAHPIAISAQLPTATVGASYSAVLAVSGGSAPYSFAVRSGTLPPGLHLSATSGTISGMPNRTGSFSFMVSVADKSRTAEGLRTFTIPVGKSVPAPQVSVAISPASLSLASGASHQFAAQVLPATNPEVVWAASAGTVTSTGLFTAPTVSAATTVQLVATSKADPGKRALATVNVSAAATAVAPLSMANTSLPEAVEGTPYSASLRASGGTAPYRWKIASGALPVGFVLDTAEGTINGVTSLSGGFPFTVEASDASGQSVTRRLSLNVALAEAAGTDGPAELPRVFMKSSLADTPAPGASHQVKTAAQLKAALSSAKCGDTIALQAGETFNGVFVLPAKSCDDNHWIVVRTSAPDRALPPEGSRVTPCYAGVASLPGRPSFGCAKASNVLAKIAFSGTGSGPLSWPRARTTID